MTALTAQTLRDALEYNHITGLFTWRVRPCPNVFPGDTAGCAMPDGYIRIWLRRRSYPAHRLAWLYMTDAWPSDDIDHINGVKDDNRFSNLRQATRAENCRNRSSHSKSASGIKGVRKHPRYDTYRAMIWVGGKNLCLGSFRTAEDAKLAYETAAEKFYGHFAGHLRNRVTSAHRDSA